MPVIVRKKVTTDQLQYGDLVESSTFGDAAGRCVKAKKFMRTRYLVTFGELGQDGNVEKSFKPEAVFTVQRSEQTFKEIHEEKQRDQIRSLRYTMNRRCENRHTTILKAHADDESPYLSSDEISQIIEDQERAATQRRLQFDRDKFMDAGVDELTALKGAFGKLVEASRRRVNDPLHRSTGVLTNLISDVQSYVWGDIAQEVTREFSVDELEEALASCWTAVRNTPAGS